MTTLICIDTESQKYPELVRLERSQLAAKDVEVISSAETARRRAAALGPADKFVVASCDDIAPINLAAAVKKDNPALDVEVLCPHATGSLYSRAEAAGINKVVSALKFADCVAPVDDFDIDEGFAEERSQNCWIMSVFSGSGGAGKSSVSAISAMLLASLGFKVLLVDADLQLGDIAYAFRNLEVVSAEDAFSNPNLLKIVEKKPTVVAAPEHVEDAERFSQKLSHLIGEASKRFDVIVFNTGANWSDVHVELLRKSDYSLFLVDQRVSSIRGCAKVLQLCSTLKISNLTFGFALNKVEKKAPLSAIDVVDALRIDECFEIKNGSLKVEECICSGYVEELVRDKNPMALSIFEMLVHVCPYSESSPKFKAKEEL